jgi:caffeoyl-CoA O-methyltransferase
MVEIARVCQGEKKGRNMFEAISRAMQERMNYLSEIDKRDRTDGTDKLKRLRQIPPETGKFISLFASNCPKGEFIEIGTSAGYSSLWILLALKDREEKLKTFEILPDKVLLARETFNVSGVSDKVDLIQGDFLLKHNDVRNISFCFLDCEKHLYTQCFDIVADKMVKGGFLIADNATNHFEYLKEMIHKAENDIRFDCLTVPIAKGEFVCRRR